MEATDLKTLTLKTLLTTPQGLEKLKEQEDHLCRVERPDTTAKVIREQALEIVRDYYI